MELQKKSYDRWTDDEVQALLSIYAEDEIQRDLETATRNDKVYAKISCKLSDLDIVHTGKQCREKLKKLKQDYKKIKDHNNRSGSDRRTSKWFDRLDALLGHRPAFAGAAATKDSATASLEAMVEDTETDDLSAEDETGGQSELQAAETSVFTPATTSSPRPMSPAEANKQKKSYDIWTDDKVQALLSIYAEDEIQRELETATRNDKVYAKTWKLNEPNIVNTRKQCREKLKKLKQDYKKIEDHNNQSGSDRRTSKRFDHQDALLGRRPAFSGAAATKDSAAASLGAMVEDTETDDKSAEDEVDGHTELQAAETSVFTPATTSNPRPMSPAEANKQKKSYDRWTDDEVQALLSIYAEDEIQQELEMATRNDKVYAKISCKLSDLDIVHTGKQCREKLKKLKQDYKKIKDHNKRSGSDWRTSKWFDRLDALLGHRPAFSGEAATKDSATASLGAMVEDTETDDQSADDEVDGHTELQAAETSVFTPATTSNPRPMSPAEANKQKKSYDRWTDDEVQALLSIYAEETATRNDKVYVKISCKLSELNIIHTGKQCREKLKKLKQDYKKIKDHNKRSGNEDRRTSKWFDRLDALLGHRPAFSDEAATKDSTALLEAMVEDTETDDQSADDETGGHTELLAAETSVFTPATTSNPRPMSPAEANKQKKSYDRWTDDEVKALLSIYAEETATRNGKVYTKISCKLSELNIVHTGKQCREKLKKLKQDYKKIKDHNKRSGSNRRTSKWFDRLDALLGHRPAFSGAVATKDSATASLEAMVEDTETDDRSVEDETGGPTKLPAAETSVFIPASTSSSLPMSPAEANKQKKSYDRWTDDEVQALLSIYAEETATRNDKVYVKISCKLSELNIIHTGKQCREKLKKLKQDYKKIKDHNKRSGSNRRTSKWFDRLDALLGHRPAFSGEAATKDSATASLGAMVEDTETDDQSAEDEVDGHTELQAAETSVFTPATTSNPRPMSPAEANKGRGKRKRDADFLDALRDMDDANRAILQRGQEQRDQCMQLLLESQAEEREMRRQELAFFQAEAEETRRLQRDFQDGFLSVLGQLAQSLRQRNSHTAPPLD